jgi:hypothetical protein
MSSVLDKLLGYGGAVAQATPIQRKADREHTFWLRFCITPFVLLATLVAETAEKAGDSIKEEAEGLKRLVAGLKTWDLWVSFPVNRITAALALPNTSRGMVLMGGPTLAEGGIVLFPRMSLSTIGCERLLQLDAAREAAEKLGIEISDTLKAQITVNLDAKIAERQISGSERAQQRDARAMRAAQGQGYTPGWRRQRGTATQSAEPKFGGPSTDQAGGDDGSPDVPGL